MQIFRFTLHVDIARMLMFQVDENMQHISTILCNAMCKTLKNMHRNISSGCCCLFNLHFSTRNCSIDKSRRNRNLFTNYANYFTYIAWTTWHVYSQLTRLRWCSEFIWKQRDFTRCTSTEYDLTRWQWFWCKRLRIHNFDTISCLIQLWLQLNLFDSIE